MHTIALSLLACLAAGPAPGAVQENAPPVVQRPPEQRRPDPDRPAERPTGVLVAKDGIAPGYTLFAPLRSGTTYLLDVDGRAVHTWQREDPPGNAVYLLPNGHLMRAERVDAGTTLHAGGAGGRIVELDWDGNVIWTYEVNDDDHRLHHDFEPLPNGNLLVLLWERRSRLDAGLRGRDPDSLTEEEGLWPDAVLEIEPVRPGGAKVVWEWHAFDHLVQDFHEEFEGHAVVAEHPRRLNVNIGTAAALAPETGADADARRDRDAQLRGLGYLGGGGRDGGRDRDSADWMHTNSIDYDPELDLIALSVRGFSEVLVIDHSTTAEDARGSSGGRQGVGGDIVWRYGNPANHHAGGVADRVCFGQHDARWTRLDGQPAISIFNNGDGRPGDEPYSSVELIVLPMDEGGRVAAPVDGRFVPREPTYVWTAEEPSSMYSSFISGAQRLPHGGFLVCEGAAGRLLETSAEGEVIWEFVSPIRGELGGPPGRGGRRGGRSGDARPGDGPPGAAGPPRGRPPGGRPGPPGDGRGGPGGPGNGPGAGPGRGPSATAAFRAERIAPDHPGLRGRELVPRDLPKGPARPGSPERLGSPERSASPEHPGPPDRGGSDGGTPR
ncbi:MAG: aryl-sulfate sulfotransferase [Planctomycetota bacterium]